MVEELKFIEGGAELLNDVRPLWKKLNAFHAAKSPHFAESFARTNFSDRKRELEHKAKAGRLLVSLAVTASAEYVGYCVGTVIPEGDGTGKIGEIDSMFVFGILPAARCWRRFVTRCLDWFEENHATKVVVFVGVGNEEVLEFYKMFDFLPRAIRLERNETSE
jgi:diamine N-acetyltransferase